MVDLKNNKLQNQKMTHDLKKTQVNKDGSNFI